MQINVVVATSMSNSIVSLQQLVDIEVFLVSRRVEDSLASKDTTPCLSWCYENKSKLRKLKVELLCETIHECNCFIVSHFYRVHWSSMSVSKTSLNWSEQENEWTLSGQLIKTKLLNDFLRLTSVRHPIYHTPKACRGGCISSIFTTGTGDGRS